MRPKTIRAHYDGKQVRLDEPCQLERDTQLLIVVVPRSADAESEDWITFSSQGLNSAYGDQEPDYSLAALKEPNPDYAGK